MFVDSHCHLDFPDFAEELDDVVARARQAGVSHMLTIGTHMSKIAQVKAVADRFDNICYSIGLHPNHVKEDGICTVEDLLKATQDSKVVAIGESGLDYFYDYSPVNIQQESFRRHIRACLETDLPIIIHTRDAEEDTIKIMDEESPDQKLRGVMHCFSSSKDLAIESLKRDFYISFSGIVTFKKCQELRDIAKEVPMDRILIETDAPYLAPVPKRGKRNEPAFVAHTAALLAEVKGVTVEELGKQTTDNFFRLFNKMPR